MKQALRLLALALVPRLLAAQGVTTAALQGVVVDENDAPIAGATVRVTNTLDGRRWEITTRSTGSYLLEDVDVGGPYRIEVRALGLTSEAREGIVLALGERIVADFTLRPAPVELAPVTIKAAADPVLSPARTGPAEMISRERIDALPNLGRDFLSLALLSPHAAISPSSRRAPSGGLTIGGENRLFNAFQIDGGMNFDPYTGRLPGRETLPRPISLEALEEIQVLVAPFDVRNGGFAGGLANAVTKTGTNAVHGSMFGYLADGDLVGKNAAGDPVQGFTTWQYGGTVGGPIVRDRAHYFVSLDMQHRVVPDPGPLIADTVGGADLANIGIRYASATRFQDILRNTYGIDPGTLGPSDGEVPATDVLAKITVQLGRSAHLELSHHYADGDRLGFIDRQYLQYLLTSAGQGAPATANASRLILTSLLGGRWSNELIVSRLGLRDDCRPVAAYPRIRVRADAGLLLAGAPETCPASFSQRALELTDNLTTELGSHVVTLGTHLESLSFEDAYPLGTAGIWDFRSLDSLQTGRGFHYERTLPGPSGSGAAEFDARQLGLYVQDRWSPARWLTLTAGLRMDVTVLPDPIGTFAPLKDSLGLDTGRLPSGEILWSPRLGVNYDLGGEGRTYLRGGVGLFSGRIPYSWIGSAYRDDGSQLFLSCDGTQVPRFDPLNQPTTCANGAGASPRVSFFDPGVKLPQDLKISVGADQRLPGAMVGTVDVLYTRAVHQLYFSDADLPSPVGAAAGEGGRPLYGTIDPATGFATPARRYPGFGPVIRVSDRGGDNALVLSVQVRKPLGDHGEVGALYAYTRAQDRMSLVNFQASPNFQNTPLDGTLDDRRLGTSYFDIPHRVQVSALVSLPAQVHLSLLYAGASGAPFTYTVNGDANADGVGGSSLVNDILYVPRDSLDITLKDPTEWSALNRFIQSEPCLNQQRGRILRRNSCRNPWFGTLNARVAKAFPTISGQSLELMADVYNVLNLIKRQWGQSRFTAPNPPPVPLLRLAGYDVSAGRGIYRLQPQMLGQLDDFASRWQMELGVRYVF